MTISNGFYCPECDVKYVEHRCKDSLPCSHPKLNSVYVWAKHYSGGAEGLPHIHIIMLHKGISFELTDTEDEIRDLLTLPLIPGFRPSKKKVIDLFTKAFEHHDGSAYDVPQRKGVPQ